MTIFEKEFTPDRLISAPWMKWLQDHNGWGESNKNSALAKFARYCHLKWLTVIGRAHAWCAVMANAALIESGFKGTENAGAVSFRTLGTPCSFSFGAALPITHASEQHHITFFVSWADEAKKLAYCFGGNQADTTKISVYDVSGNAHGHDQVIPSPRWPVKRAA